LVDVAQAAGVHAGTASRALNPATRHEVSRQTVRRVERAAERLGYVPNAMARGLRTSRSYIVALVVPDITNPLFPPIARGAEQVLGQSGYTLVLTNTNNERDIESAQIEAMRARGVDGFIVATARLVDPMLDSLGTSRVPVVLVNRYTDSRSLPYVGGDDRHAITLCVEHLADLGHERIVHLAGPADTSTGRDRASAFRQAMRARRLPVATGGVRTCSAMTVVGGRTTMRRVLATNRSFTGVVAANDLIALGALDAMSEAGLDCPADVSITGLNDAAFMDRLTPALTTVRIPLHDMGASAATAVLDMIARPDSDASVQRLLPVELVVRNSTRPPTDRVRAAISDGTISTGHRRASRSSSF
jgi:LacI family transcriptional regulator